MRNDARTVSLYIGLGAIAASVFAADFFTPLGVAVWIFYIVPVGLTILGDDDGAPVIAAIGCTLLDAGHGVHRLARGLVVTWVAYVNRACRSSAVIWTIALLARGLASSHASRVEADDWIRRTQTQLLDAMQGELSVADIGARALRVCVPAIDAPVVALYAFDGTVLRLTATEGLRAGVGCPARLSTWRRSRR